MGGIVNLIDNTHCLLHRGDPEKHDNYGNTGLHLSSAKGHLNCVTFLINFGVNIWDLDIDMHSAKDLAAINNREDILKYLDSITSQQEMTNAKLAKSQQEKAKKESEKRMKSFQKLQKKAEKTASKENEKIEKRRQSLHPGLLAATDNLRPSDGRSGGRARSPTSPTREGREERAVGLVGALRIPGVIEFSLCLFFAKLVSDVIVLENTDLSKSTNY